MLNNFLLQQTSSEKCVCVAKQKQLELETESVSSPLHKIGIRDIVLGRLVDSMQVRQFDSHLIINKPYILST